MKILFSIAFLIALCFASGSQANDVSACEMQDQGLFVPELSTSFPEVNDHLRKGLTATFVHEVRKAQETKVFQCQIYYDLWEEQYLVKSWSQGSASESTRYVKESAALRHCALIPWSASGKITIKTQLNPATRDQIDNTRRWLATKGIASNSDAFVGRAVNAFMDLDRQQTVERHCEIGG